jgi:hypothetical protein
LELVHFLLTTGARPHALAAVAGALGVGTACSCDYTATLAIAW